MIQSPDPHATRTKTF